MQTGKKLKIVQAWKAYEGLNTDEDRKTGAKKAKFPLLYEGRAALIT